MKIIHTADWHLGKKLGDFSRHDEQQDVLEEIIRITEQENAQAVLICGDLFDTFNPPAEATALFYRTLKRLSGNGQRPVIAIAGNHDSPDRVESPDRLARELGIFLLGYARESFETVVLDSGTTVSSPSKGLLEISHPGSAPVKIIYAPYTNENRLRKHLCSENKEKALKELLKQTWHELGDRHFTDQSINLFCGHFFMAGSGSGTEEEPEEEKTILHPGGLEMLTPDLLPNRTQYAALGHLHRPQRTSETPCPVWYSGSPLSYSVSEAAQTKQINMITVAPGKPAEIEEIVLKKGRRIDRKYFDSIQDAVSWLSKNPDPFVEVHIRTPDYITTEEKMSIMDSHDRILALIPEIIGVEETDESKETFNLEAPTQDLFIEYFKSRNGGASPPDDLQALFREVLSTQDDDGSNGGNE